MHAGRLAELLGRWSSGSEPLYRKLAARLEGLVERGEIPADGRLPTERALAAELAVSRNTAVAAYDVLRDRGLVERRRGSGTFVRRPPRPGRGVVAEFNPMFLHLLDPVPNLIDLTCAAPPQPAYLAEVVAEAAVGDFGIGYHPSGIPALRQAIADHYAAQGVPTDPAQIVVTSGAQQAISLLAQLFLRPGDAVAVEELTYPGALDAFRGGGARILGVPPPTGCRCRTSRRSSAGRNWCTWCRRSRTRPARCCRRTRRGGWWRCASRTGCRWSTTTCSPTSRSTVHGRRRSPGTGAG